MPNIKREILDNLEILFRTQGVVVVEGTYDYPKGELTFYFKDEDVKTESFTYKGDGQGSYSESGFKTVLSDTGGKIIKEYNVKFQPDYLAEFMAEVTE